MGERPLLERFKYVVFLLVAVALIAGVAVLLWRRPEPTTITVIPPEPTPIPTASPTPGPYTVYVTGEVAEPEILVTVPYGSRVKDAIEAAGGSTDNADLARVNLSQILNDGDQVHVPALEQGDIQTATPNRPSVVHINSATVEELAALPGIGPSLAQAIIDYRTANGPFTSFDDLDKVDGIGPAKLDGIRDQVVFD